MSSEGHSTKSPKYFFDTYALIEIYEGNEAFAKYLDSSFFMTKLNVFEFHYYLLRKGSEKEVDEVASGFGSNIRDFDERIIRQASKFRFLHKKRNHPSRSQIIKILS